MFIEVFPCIKDSVYIDEGKSGTKVKGRDEYQRLLADMDLDRFDIIVIKSQDRLNRNTRDWYIFADHLNRSGKRLFLYMENKFYVPSEDALITGIKAILAEEYSRDLSKKLNNANQRRIDRARSGEPVSAMGNGQVYGYRIVNKKWVIDTEEAEIVRKMYGLYIDLHSIRKVRDALNEMGYRNKKGRLFTNEAIARVLRNEMHKGWVVLNRHHRDFDRKEVVIKPEDEWVIVKNDHEPIVSEKVWDDVNDEIQSHRNKGNNKGRGKKNGTSPLSGKMFCTSCGRVLWQHSSNGYTNWYCSGKMSGGSLACDTPVAISDMQIRKYLVTLADHYLDYSTIEYSKTLLKRRSVKWLEDLKAMLTTTNDNSKLEAEVEKLERKKAKLLDLYTDELISKDEFIVKKSELDQQIESKRALLVPVEENEDIRDIDETIQNIDREIDLLFSDEALIVENKVNFLMEHIREIRVCKNRDVCVILDKVAGAFLFVDGGKAEMFITTGEDGGDGRNGGIFPFDREHMHETAAQGLNRSKA